MTDHLTDEVLAVFLDGTIETWKYTTTVTHLLACDQCYRRYVDASKMLLSLREEE